jgi:uncharacterized protein YkvS
MAGFDEFVKILRENNNGRINSMNGLNGIIEKINESIRIQNVTKEEVVDEMNLIEDIKLSAAEQRIEDQKQRMEKSKSIIMNNNSGSPNTQNADAQTNLNVKEIFPLNFSSENIVQGLIFSEVLGTPICKRKHRRRR